MGISSRKHNSQRKRAASTPGEKMKLYLTQQYNHVALMGLNVLLLLMVTAGFQRSNV